VAVPVLDLSGDPADVRLHGQVGKQQHRRFAGRGLGDLRAGVLAASLIADDHHDLPALAGELPGRLQSHTAAGTGDDDDLVPDRLLRRRCLAACRRRRSTHLKPFPFCQRAITVARGMAGGPARRGSVLACRPGRPASVAICEPRPRLGERASRHLRDLTAASLAVAIRKHRRRGDAGRRLPAPALIRSIAAHRGPGLSQRRHGPSRAKPPRSGSGLAAAAIKSHRARVERPSRHLGDSSLHPGRPHTADPRSARLRATAALARAELPMGSAVSPELGPPGGDGRDRRNAKGLRQAGTNPGARDGTARCTGPWVWIKPDSGSISLTARPGRRHDEQ
jgi:hypothetical protein